MNPDVVTTSLQQLMKPYSETFTVWHPVLDKFAVKGKLKASKVKGSYLEFGVVQGGPGRTTAIRNGGETINGGRRQSSRRGNEYGGRSIHAFDVPRKDIAEANNEMDILEIIKNYPEQALSDFHEDWAQQFVLGNVSDMSNQMTLNGLATYDADGSHSRDGIFSFAAPDSQTETVHGLEKQGSAGDPTTGWYNQYTHVASFQTNGRRKLRDVYYKAARQGKVGGPVDLMLSDPDSYGNYLESLDEHVVVEDEVKNDHVPDDIKQGIKFLKATWYIEDAINIEDEIFDDTPPETGLIYGIKSNDWEAVIFGRSDLEGKGFLEISDPMRDPQSDSIRYEMVLFWAIICKQLRTQFAATGCATP